MVIIRFYITPTEIARLRGVSDVRGRLIYKQLLQRLNRTKAQGITYIHYSEAEDIPLELLYFALNLNMNLVNWNAYYTWKERQEKQMQTTPKLKSKTLSDGFAQMKKVKGK